MTKKEKATLQMEAWAMDDSHGYSQYNRWGNPDFDCSSAVISAWEKAGVPVKTKGGATYTGNMRKAFLENGFEDVTNQVDLNTGAGLKRGDVLLNEGYHTAMYCGGHREVEASCDEHGGIGGMPGDQTGHEFLIQSYRNYPWGCVLRYKEEEETYMFTVKPCRKGDKNKYVKLGQRLLKGRGYKDDSGHVLKIDRIFGDSTEQATKKFQKAINKYYKKDVLTVNGEIDIPTWKYLIDLDK